MNHEAERVWVDVSDPFESNQMGLIHLVASYPFSAQSLRN